MRTLTCGLLLVGSIITTGSSAEAGATVAAPEGAQVETVRFAYVVPSNRSPQASAVSNLRYYVRLIHDWYRDQMHRNGFGARAFRYESESDGITPMIHVVPVAETDAYIRGDIWSRTIQAASNAGISVWATGEVWILVPEIHLQSSDGSIAGGVALGAGYGSGSGPGVAMVGSEKLTLMTPLSLTNNTAYAGQVMPTIGPYPLVQDVSFPWFEGTTISSIVSSAVGALAHELGHAFGLPHDFRNDTNFHGNLMGNGLRGFRGAIHPATYANDDCRLAYAQALAMSTNRWLHPARPVSDLPIGGGSSLDAAESSYPLPPALSPQDRATLACFRTDPASLLPGVDLFGTDDTAPQISGLTSGTVTPSGGQITISFTASDDFQLAAAMLQKDGERVAERTLTGGLVATSLSTPIYDPGASNSFSVSVYDLYGNRTEVATTVTPAAGPNRGPRPGFLLHQSLARTGQQVQLDATLTGDPDSASRLYEWDFEGDGVYDTAPSATATLARSFATPATLPVRLRVTDPAGAASVSTIIPLRILPTSGPGEVPSLSVRKSTVTPGNLTLSWSASCRPTVQDYAIYEGTLGAFYSHSMKDCADAGHDLSEDISPAASSSYYLLVPLGVNVEGLYGESSGGAPRPLGVEACAVPQMIDPCP